MASSHTSHATRPLRVAIETSRAPATKPELMSQGIVANGLVYTSGQVGKDPAKNDQLVEGPITARTHRCIQNLTAILEAGGSSIGDVIEVNIFLTDMAQYGEVNQIYQQYFGNLKPARTCVAVKTLPGNTDVEIKCIGIVRRHKGEKQAKL
ncbi:unnamed protein product [Clonostachys byssicola]|uniref:Uncharacterized protein n=1 Tax=Clonostachys byssicola TaxID=160290 RepID=A0A9N9TYJ9_9HYPO|nr:unnamed protein product [Clonostachys byssicola]